MLNAGAIEVFVLDGGLADSVIGVAIVATGSGAGDSVAGEAV